MARAIAVAAAAILAVVAVVVGLIVAAVATVLAVYNTNDRKQLAAAAASTALDREVKINGDAGLDLGWVTRIRLADVSIANADWAKAREPNMVQVGQLDLAIDVRQLLRGRILVPEIYISRRRTAREERPGSGELAVLDRCEGGRGQRGTDAAENTGRSATRPGPGPLHLQRCKDKQKRRPRRHSTPGHGRSRRPESPSDRRGQYKIQVKSEAQGHGGPFAIRFFGGPWEQLQGSEKPYPLDVDLTLSDLQVKTSGTVTDPMQLKGLDLKLDVRGDNTANLFAISGIALPPSPPYRFSGNVDHRGTEWRLTEASGRMGGSDMRGTVGVDTGGKRLLLKADLVSDNLLAKFGPFIGATPGGKEREEAVAEESKTAGGPTARFFPTRRSISAA